jgi:dihydroorotate dehydrogenase
MLYKKFIRPLIFALSKKDPEISHEKALAVMCFLQKYPQALAFLKRQYCISSPKLSQKICGIQFPNPIGLAAGFDKNGVVLPFLSSLGFGFVEAGTITLFEQSGNPRPRIIRFPKVAALINSMGFPNNGACAATKHITPQSIPTGINIGKSIKTPLENAHHDYCNTLTKLYEFADYFTICISSPNTPNLRRLHERKFLEPLLKEIVYTAELRRINLQHGNRKPIFLKISPDLKEGQIDTILDAINSTGINGIVATNTTTDLWRLPQRLCTRATEGGLSGSPAFAKAWCMVSTIHQMDPKLPIIAVGGINSAQRAWAMFKAGASLVQVLTGFVFEGSTFARTLNLGLLKLMDKHGVKHISELQRAT